MPGSNDMVIDDQMRFMLTPSEVGKLLHLHTNTVRRWTDSGLIKAYRINHRGDRRYKQEDINHFLNQMNRGKRELI